MIPLILFKLCTFSQILQGVCKLLSSTVLLVVTLYEEFRCKSL